MFMFFSPPGLIQGLWDLPTHMSDFMKNSWDVPGFDQDKKKFRGPTTSRCILKGTAIAGTTTEANHRGTDSRHRLNFDEKMDSPTFWIWVSKIVGFKNGMGHARMTNMQLNRKQVSSSNKRWQ